VSEKQLRKSREMEEKMKLEQKVLQEYDDETSGKCSKPHSLRNGSDLPLPKPYLFLHVPKTAGSTLAGVFRANELNSQFYHFWSHPRLHELPILQEKSSIFGHFRYGLHTYINKTCTYITWLREPVSRVISYYHFHLQDSQDPFHEFAKRYSFDEWVERSPAAHNEMTKCLSGIRSEDEPSNKTFEIAKHHLRSFGFVGLQEYFDESLVLMKSYLGFTNIGYSMVKVGTHKPKEEEISLQTIENIRRYNRMDVELYRIAQEIFQKEIAEVGTKFHDEMKLLKKS